ncbi:efflux RND transporter periplasmic adaptor subunit [Brumicola nitratireducens]|uniref:Efflux transporter, RND family, MFP subunit n=1 Tax=Glaciecola nitratireducens (strain JCM 12485 / KCTC 12276 / FR1064) TaxID=1085623 RepID=G4QFG9_GLANF|nr:efflux RND transporter periplasmic adaptor subunit [Glaciecola nitratireducens]AEP28594.1 efflux transporter, RND family, MFP subunit [Glaciecola nitratireducens FR1064]
MNTNNAVGSKLSLLFLCISSFILLIVLILFSGDKTAIAFADDQSLVIENAKVNVQAISIQSAYTKQRKVYGLIESAQQANLGFELSGVINETLVAEGERVVKGQILATLDQQRLMAQKKELDAALLRAKADAKLASLSAKRTAELVKKRLEPDQRLDEANAALDAANALVNEVRARHESLNVELQKSSLVAPFNGQVVKQLLDSGTVVTMGQPVFALMAEVDLEARIGLPTQSPLALSLGERYTLSYEDQPVPAKLISLAKQRNRATRAIDALFQIDAQDAEKLYLMPGDLVSLSVDVEIDKQGAWIPIGALSNGVRGLWTLFVIDKSTGSQIIQPRSVYVEYMEQDYAFVSGALDQGDLLVVSGLHRLTPNQVVQNIQVINTARN